MQSFSCLYQKLLQSNPYDLVTPQPTLARASQAGSDNCSLTFTLRQGVKFASGNSLCPEDVIFPVAGH